MFTQIVCTEFQRLNDAVEEMRIHLNLPPPGQNIINPIEIEDSKSEDNNG